MITPFKFSRLLVVFVVLLVLLGVVILILPAEVVPRAVLWLSSHSIRIISLAAIVFVLLGGQALR